MRPAALTVALGLALVLAGATFDAEPLYVPGLAFALLGLFAVAWVLVGAFGVDVARSVGARTVVEEQVVDVRLRVRAGLAPLLTGVIDDPLLPGPVPLTMGQREMALRVRASFSRRGRRELAPVRVVIRDAFRWLRSAPAGAFDVIVADFPDPDDAALAKLYSVELYGLVRRALAPGGRVVVQSGSPYFAQRAYWSIAASLEEAGLSTSSYHVDVPSFGDWGFHLAAVGEARPPLRVQAPPGGLRFLDGPTLAAAATFGADRRRPPGDLASTLDRPRILEFAREGYKDY